MMKAQVRKRVIPLAGAALLLVVMVCFALWRAHEYARPTRPYPLLLPVRVNGEWGYIDRTGKMVIRPRFAGASFFEEGYATVTLRQSLFAFPIERKQTKAVINTRGAVIRRIKYGSLRHYGEGLAAVNVGGTLRTYRREGRRVSKRLEGGKWGYVDHSEKTVIEPTYDRALPFSGGLAPVKLAGKWGFIDTKGSIVIEPEFDSASSFSEGLAEVKVNGKYGYIDETGKVVIEPQFDRAMPFRESAASVNIGFKRDGPEKTHTEGKWGLIDRDGQWLARPRFDDTIFIIDGMAAVRIGGKWGFVDNKGVLAVKAQFDDVHWFSEGLAAVNIGYEEKEGDITSWGKWGFIDKSGRFVIEPRFDEGCSFSENLATVEVGRRTNNKGEIISLGKWGVIDKSGKWIVKARWDHAYALGEGIIRVGDKDKVGYIDAENGEFIWEPTK